MWVPPPISKKGKGVAWLFAAAWGRHGAVRGAAGGGRRAGQRPRHRPRRPPHPPEAPGPPILPHRPSRDTGRGGRVREARGRGEGSGWGAVLGGANTLPTRPKGGGSQPTSRLVRFRIPSRHLAGPSPLMVSPPGPESPRTLLQRGPVRLRADQFHGRRPQPPGPGIFGGVLVQNSVPLRIGPVVQ